MEEEKHPSPVDQAARAFDDELHTPAYASTHADPSQLDRLISLLPPADEQTLLDLGTGAGYVAFELARRNPRSNVIGLDVAGGAMRKNIENAARRGIDNVRFRRYDGVALPFSDALFHGIVCRYAFHHFPDPVFSLAEMARTLRKDGRLVLSDAVRNDLDTPDFVNRFQHLKGDGHVRMLRRAELIALAERAGFRLRHAFDTALSFERQGGGDYDALMSATPDHVLALYHLTKQEEHIRLTFDIFNGAFDKRTA